ncbi:MAG: amidohydrolase [Magnetococcus sp. DMHC-6]
MAILIKNVLLPEQGKVNILIVDQHIVAIDNTILNLPEESKQIDASGLIALPGLVNGHTHAAMTLFRGFGDDMPLMTWLSTRIWPAEAKLTDEDVYWGTRLACLEMIRSGTIFFQDMYWRFNAMARAVQDAGLRAGVGAVMIDVAGEAQAQECRRLAEQTFEQSRDYSARIQYVLTPHAIYTVSEASLRWVADFSEKHQLPVHIHLSETHTEVTECLRQHGILPAIYLDRVGLLNSRAILAHGVYLSDPELDLIAQRGATLVTNPVSNLKLAVGSIFPYSKARARHIPMALGSDGAASNNSLDLFQDLKTFALIQKHADQDPTVLPAGDAWAIATGQKAPLFGQSGRIAVGEKADLLLISQNLPEITPQHDLISNLVYAATGHVVDTVIVEGRILMQGRHIEGEKEIQQEAIARARSLCKTS